MGKAPASQFYWADWLSDVQLQSASDASRGIWINALARMWFAEEKGKLTGTSQNLIRLLMCEEGNFGRFLEEAETLGFCYVSREPNGTITLINRRMHREGKAKEANRLRQQRYYDRHKRKEKPNAKVTPPSSSSTSTTKNKEGSKLPSCPHQKIVDLWHEVLPELPPVKEWEGRRRDVLRARWSTKEQYRSLDWWRRFFEYIRTCPFLMGQVDPAPGRQRFVATLEWVVKAENFRKILEGNYKRG